MDYLLKTKKEFAEMNWIKLQHDMAYGDFKDLARRTAANKVLRDKAFNIAKDPEYDGYQRELVSVIFNFFNKKIAGSGIKSMPQNQQSTKELHKPIIRKFKKRKLYSSFKDNIWGADLGNLQSLSKSNKGFKFLLCVTDIFRKYVCVVPLKDKKGATIATAFQSILKNSNGKPNKVW